MGISCPLAILPHEKQSCTHPSTSIRRKVSIRFSIIIGEVDDLIVCTRCLRARLLLRMLEDLKVVVVAVTAFDLAALALDFLLDLQQFCIFALLLL